MKTSDIEVRDMLSVLSVVGVENRIGEVPGVESVTVNYAAGLATVRYDETRLNITDIRSAVRQGEYEPALPAATPTGGGHEGHAHPAHAAPKSPPDAAASPVAGGQPDQSAAGAPSKPTPAPSKPSPVAGPVPAEGGPAPAATEAGTDPADKKEPDKAASEKG